MEFKEEEYEQIILNNEKLVRFLINKYCPENERDEDMLQIGLIALYYAIKSYDKDHSSGAKFSYYAGTCIKGALKNEMKHRLAGFNKFYYLEDYKDINDNAFNEESNWESIIPDTTDYISQSDMNVDVDRFFDKVKLTDKEKELFNYKRNGYNESEISKIWGVSRERVRQIKVKLNKKWNSFYNEYSTA